MGKGYIKLYRQIQDCWIWFDDDKFTKGQAWVDLLMLANHKDKKASFKDEIIHIKRGQYVTSIKKLSERWGWSFNTTKKFLNLLESDNMLIRRSDNKKTLITIVNYEIYQGSDEDKNKDVDSQIDSQADSLGGSLGANKLTPNKNDNNDNNVNNGNNIIPPISPKGKAKKVNLEQQFKDMVNDTELSEPLKNKLIEWIDYKVEIKKPYRSETGFKTFLKKIGEFTLKYTDAEIIEVIDTSMSNGYQGVIWDKISKPSNNNSAYMDAIKNRVNVVDTWL